VGRLERRLVLLEQRCRLAIGLKTLHMLFVAIKFLVHSIGLLIFRYKYKNNSLFTMLMVTDQKQQKS